MRDRKFDQMSKAANAVFTAEQGKIQTLLQEEARIRSELARLQAQAEEERNRLAGDIPMQSVGADLLWQGWLARSRKQLNLELAGVMARKAGAMGKVKLAFGRKTAIQDLIHSEQEQRKRAMRDKQQEALLHLHGTNGSDK